MDWLRNDAPMRVGERVRLADDVARHAAALRLRDGDAVGLVDGRGCRATGVIVQTGRQIDVEVRRVEQVERARDVTVAIGMLDHRDRMEFAVEKCTELGVRRIVVLDCVRSQRHGVRLDRLVQKAEAAMVQSGQAWLPEVTGPVTVEAFCATLTPEVHVVVGDQFGASPTPVALPAVVMVGPEGGFTDDELAMIASHDPLRWCIGTERLRTETAAVVLTAAVQMFGRIDD